MSNLDRLKKMQGQLSKLVEKRGNSANPEIYDDDITEKAAEFMRAMDSQRKKERDSSDNDKKEMIKMIGDTVLGAIKPALEGMTEHSMNSSSEIRDAIRNIKLGVPPIEIPRIEIPEINVPEPKVHVTVPTPIVNVPPVNFPEKMTVDGEVGLLGVDLTNPLPVQLRDSKGKPVDLNIATTILGGGSSGKGDYFTIKKIENTIDVAQVSGASWSVYVAGASGSISAAIVDSTGVQYSGSNPVPVALVSGGTATSASNIVDSTGVAYTGSNPLPVGGTVAVSGVTGSVGTNILDSTGVAYSGSNPVPMTGTVAVSGITGTVGANIVDSTGVAFGGDNPFNVDGTVAVSGITNSVASAIVDSGGAQYSTSNPVPVVLVTNQVSSTAVVGTVVGDAVDDGSAPVQFGGIARTANPTAVAANDVVKATFDDLGRQLIRPMQIRDLLVTAYATLSNGTETTLVGAVAGSYLDMIYVMGANVSDVATTVFFRANTGGNIVSALQLPANGTAGVAAPVPIPQMGLTDGSGNNWTADMGDITGTTVYLTGLFSKEI